MRYPESKMSLDSAMPTSSIQAWLGQELELRGIDAMIYTRYILSILQQDSFEFEHIESDLFPMKKDLVQIRKEIPLKGKSRVKKGERRWSMDGEEMKKTAAVECLMSVSDVTEKDEGLKNLVEETYRKLKESQRLVESEAPVSACVTPVATCASTSPGAAASAPTPPIPAAVCVPDIEESLIKEECNTSREGYYDAFPPLHDKDEEKNLTTPKEISNTVWTKKNVKLSPAASDTEHATTPNELNRSQSPTNQQLRRSQSRGSSGESDDGQKMRKSHRKSKDFGSSSPGPEQQKPEKEIKSYGSKSAECARNYQSQHKSHSQRYRSRSQEKFSSVRNKHTPRPYVFYKLKAGRDPKGQVGRDAAYQTGRNRARPPGTCFFTPRYPVSPAKLGKAPKFPDSLKITDDILRLLHVRPEQEQWFDDLVSGSFPRHPIKVGHHPRRPKDENEDDLFLYEGPIDTVFPPSETRQGRLYERHSCSSVDDLVMAADVTDTVATVDTKDTQKSSRFLPFILSQDHDESVEDLDFQLSVGLIEKDSHHELATEVIPHQDGGCTPVAKELNIVVPEVIQNEAAGVKGQEMDETVSAACAGMVASPCGSEDTLKTSSSDSESTEEDEYDFSRFTDLIQNKKDGLENQSLQDESCSMKSRSERLALQIDEAYSRGISLLQDLQPEKSDWLRGDEELSGSENEQQSSPDLAEEEEATIRTESCEQTLQVEMAADHNAGEKLDGEKDEEQVLMNNFADDLSDVIKTEESKEEELGKDNSELGATILDGRDCSLEEVQKEDVELGAVELDGHDGGRNEAEEEKSQTDNDVKAGPEMLGNKPGVVHIHVEDDPGDMKVEDTEVGKEEGVEVNLEGLFQQLAVFETEVDNVDGGEEAGDVTDEMKVSNLQSDSQGDVDKSVHVDEKIERGRGTKRRTNLTVDASTSNLLATLEDVGVLSPNRTRLDGFPALLPKDDATENCGDEEDGRSGKTFVTIDLKTDDGFAKLQDLSTFLDFKVEEIKDLLPREEDTINDTVLLETKSASSSKSSIPRYLFDNKENESLVLSQSKAAESTSGEGHVDIESFTAPAASVKQTDGVYLTKDDVVVRVGNSDSSDEESSDEAGSESSSTTGSDGYSEILGDLDSVLAGINISSEEITADVAENSAQFLENLKLLDDSLDMSISTDENSGSDIVGHCDTWAVADDGVDLRQHASEPMRPGLPQEFVEKTESGMSAVEQEFVTGNDSLWNVSDENTILTQQYKMLHNNYNPNELPVVFGNLPDRNSQGLTAPPFPCGADFMGHDNTWSVDEQTSCQGLPLNLSDRLDRSYDDCNTRDTWTVPENPTKPEVLVNQPIIQPGLHHSFSDHTDNGLLQTAVNLSSVMDVLNPDIVVQDHDKTADSGIHYAEDNCEMAENIALATCGNLSSDGESSSEESESDSPCLNHMEHSTPLAKHIAAITRRRHPGIGKKWPPEAPTASDNQDDGYGEGQVWPEQEATKHMLYVDNEPWNIGVGQNAYLGSPRILDPNWGSLSETTGSGPASKDHSPWPTLDNLYCTDNSEWQERSTPSLSSSSSHGMRKVDADWQTLQINASESTGYGEPLYVNVNDTSLDNSSDTLYFLPSLSDSPKVEELLAEASSLLDGMDHERFHQLLLEIENQSHSDAENIGDFSEALQKLAVNEGNYAVLQELDKLFQTYMHADDLPVDDDDKLLIDAVDDLACYSQQDPDDCMSPGGEEYVAQDEEQRMKTVLPVNVNRNDPTYNLWKDSGKQFSGHLNWYLGGEESGSNISKGHSCSDVAYWSDTETLEEKPATSIHTSASYGQLSNLARKRSRQYHAAMGSYFTLPHSQSAILQPSEFSAFRDKIPEKKSYVRSEPHLPAHRHGDIANFMSDSDLLSKRAPIITLQKETKATIGEGYNKQESTNVVISPTTHFRPIRSLSQKADAQKANTGTVAGEVVSNAVEAAVGASLQHVERPPLFSFSPDKEEDYQLFVTSDSDSESAFVPKFKVNLNGEKWSQTEEVSTGRAVGDKKLKSTCSYTDDCIETCRKKLELCSQEILLQCKKYLKKQLTDAILEEDFSCKDDSGESSESLASAGNNATTNEISTCDHNGNLGDAGTQTIDPSQKPEEMNIVLSCHDRGCFCPECGIQRQVAAPDIYWHSGESFYSCSGQDMDKKIVENRDGESLQSGNVALGKNIKEIDEKEKCVNVEGDGDTDTAETCPENRHCTDKDARKEVDDLDIVALCNRVDLLEVRDESSHDTFSNKEDGVEKSVISDDEGRRATPLVPVHDVFEIWAPGTDTITQAAESVTKYSIWSVGGDGGLPSLPVGVEDDVNKIIAGCLIDGASNRLKDTPLSEDSKSDVATEEAYILLENEAFTFTEPPYKTEDLDLSLIQPPHRPRAFYSSELEEAWMRTPDFIDSTYRGKKRRSRSGSVSNKPCSFYMEGNCRRADCRFSHDLSSITCRFWEKGDCFKGVTCPFMHGYNSSEKSSIKPETFPFESKSSDFLPSSQESKSDEEKS